jgi:hypothetical protein
MHLTISIKTKASGKKHRNDPGIFLAYFKDNSDSVAFLRMCRSRGIDAPNVARRECDEDEYISYAHPHRIGFSVSYNSWQALIDDEKKYRLDPAWYATLEALRSKYPQFNTAQP